MMLLTPLLNVCSFALWLQTLSLLVVTELDVKLAVFLHTY